MTITRSTLGRPLACALALAALVGAREVRAADDAAPLIELAPCEAAQRGREVKLYARFQDASAIFEPKLLYRDKGDKNWKSAPFTREDTHWVASVPGREIKGSFEYFVEVFDEHGNGPAREGSPEKPIPMRVMRRAAECARPAPVPVEPAVEPSASIVEPAPAPPLPSMAALSQIAPAPAPAPTSSCDTDSPPFYCRTWFWIVASSVVLASAGATTYVLLREDSGGAALPSNVDLMITGPGPGDALLRGAHR